MVEDWVRDAGEDEDHVGVGSGSRLRGSVEHRDDGGVGRAVLIGRSEGAVVTVEAV